MKGEAGSVALWQGAHHILANQKEDGFNDLLPTLLQALEFGGQFVTATATAREILNRMKSQS